MVQKPLTTISERFIRLFKGNIFEIEKNSFNNTPSNSSSCNAVCPVSKAHNT